jgi:hypothetical protein
MQVLWFIRALMSILHEYYQSLVQQERTSRMAQTLTPEVTTSISKVKSNSLAYQTSEPAAVALRFRMLYKDDFDGTEIDN